MTMTMTNLSNWLAQSDSRETSPEILAAIFAVAENHMRFLPNFRNEETLNAIWDDPEHYDVLVTIYEIVTQNGLNDPTDFFWGANGSSWADSRNKTQSANRLRAQTMAGVLAAVGAAP